MPIHDPGAVTTSSPYEQLLGTTAHDAQTLMSLPIIQRALAGQVTLHQYRAFLAEAYHHVKHTVPLLMACGSRLPPSHEWLRTALAHYISEEIGHEEWILNDIQASGGNALAVRESMPGRATEFMVSYAYDTIQRNNPCGFLGMVHVLEGTSIQLATRAAEVLQNALGLPAQAFTYLSTHGSLDIEHTRFFSELVNRLDDPEDISAVRHAAKRFYYLYAEIFRNLPEA